MIWKGSYDRQKLSLVVISYLMSETRHKLVSLFHIISYEMTLVYDPLEQRELTLVYIYNSILFSLF